MGPNHDIRSLHSDSKVEILDCMEQKKHSKATINLLYIYYVYSCISREISPLNSHDIPTSQCSPVVTWGFSHGDATGSTPPGATNHGLSGRLGAFGARYGSTGAGAWEDRGITSENSNLGSDWLFFLGGISYDLTNESRIDLIFWWN